MPSTTLASITKALYATRQQTPLVHHITNYVTVNDCANATLAMGGSPIMADDVREAEDIVRISAALVLNMGTLNEDAVSAMLAAGAAANAAGKPVIFDPVGAGASALRNQTVQRILENLHITVLRGNISEVRFVAGCAAATKGVDAADADGMTDTQAAALARQVAQQLHCTVAITGAVDYISDGQRCFALHSGTPALAKVSGTGCMCNSLIASLAGATSDALVAAIGGVLCMGIAGELAQDHSRGSGSFRVGLIDELSRMDGATLTERAKLHEI